MSQKYCLRCLARASKRLIDNSSGLCATSHMTFWLQSPNSERAKALRSWRQRWCMRSIIQNLDLMLWNRVACRFKMFDLCRNPKSSDMICWGSSAVTFYNIKKISRSWAENCQNSTASSRTHPAWVTPSSWQVWAPTTQEQEPHWSQKQWKHNWQSNSTTWERQTNNCQ